MAPRGTRPPRVRVHEGIRIYDFFDDDTFRLYQSLQAPPPPSISLSSYLEEFKDFPQVDDVLITYFDECLKSADEKLRLAPSILIGCISELLVVRLVKTVGEYLEDPNVIDRYYQKRTMTSKQSYTIQTVRIGRERLEESITLDIEQRSVFTEFNNIVVHLFDSIRLRRNEYVHPKPDMSLDDLPPENVITTHVQGFNLYAKIILKLINIFKENMESPE